MTSILRIEKVNLTLNIQMGLLGYKPCTYYFSFDEEYSSLLT